MDVKKIKLEISGISASDNKQGTYALILSEKSSTRRLPIVIGLFEAQAIAIEMEKMKPSRPLTYDLFSMFSNICDITFIEVQIIKLLDGIFYANIFCKKIDGSTFEVDARPSDAIVIALKFNLPIYTTPSVMNQAGIDFKDQFENKDENKTSKLDKNKSSNLNTNEIKDITQSLHELSKDILEIALEDAIKLENYEIAAKIRDEIIRRNNLEKNQKRNSGN